METHTTSQGEKSLLMWSADSSLQSTVHSLLSWWHITFQLSITLIKRNITPRTSRLAFQPEDLIWTSACEQHTHISPGRKLRSARDHLRSHYAVLPASPPLPLHKKYFRLVILIPCWTLTLIIFVLVQYCEAESIYLSCFKSDFKLLECYQKVPIYCC